MKAHAADLGSPQTNRKFFLAVLFITLLAFALRVYRLDAQSLWWDEIAPILIVRLPFPDWLTPVYQDRGHPPGFYFMLWLWLFNGLSEFSVRFLSVVEGTLSVAILAQLGRRIGGTRVGVIAALLMALSPFYIWYAQESRMYAPLILTAVASSWAFVELIHRPRWNVAVALLLVDCLGLYAHYLFGLFLMTQLLFLALARGRQPQTLRWVLFATLGAGLVFMPWLISLQLTTIQGRPNLDWIPNAQWYDPALSLMVLLLFVPGRAICRPFYPDEERQRAFAEQDAFKQAMDSRYVVVQELWFPGLVLTKYKVTQ